MLEDDFRLTESSAILKYLADKTGSPAYPSDPRQRARVNEMMDWFNTGLYRELGYGFIYPQVFPYYRRATDELQAGTIAWGRKGQGLVEDSGREADRSEKRLSLRRRDHHRRYF
jgi:glutathione S-transferase